MLLQKQQDLINLVKQRRKLKLEAVLLEFDFNFKSVSDELLVSLLINSLNLNALFNLI